MTTGPELIRNLVDLTTEVRELRAAANALASRTDSAERVIRLIAVVAVLGLVLTAVVGSLYLNQRDTSRRLQTSITAQETLRARAVCPLYGEFFKAYHPELKRAGKERADYVAVFSRLREQAAVLNCPAVPGG